MKVASGGSRQGESKSVQPNLDKAKPTSALDDTERFGCWSDPDSKDIDSSFVSYLSDDSSALYGSSRRNRFKSGIFNYLTKDGKKYTGSSLIIGIFLGLFIAFAGSELKPLITPEPTYTTYSSSDGLAFIIESRSKSLLNQRDAKLPKRAVASVPKKQVRKMRKQNAKSKVARKYRKTSMSSRSTIKAKRRYKKKPRIAYKSVRKRSKTAMKRKLPKRRSAWSRAIKPQIQIRTRKYSRRQPPVHQKKKIAKVRNTEEQLDSSYGTQGKSQINHINQKMLNSERETIVKAH